MFQARIWSAAIVAAGALGCAIACHSRCVNASPVKDKHSLRVASPRRVVRLTASGGIGFDDILYSSQLHKIVAPAGGNGCVALLDPTSHVVTNACVAAATQRAYAGGHGDGTTSADVGGGLLFAIDRTTQNLSAIELSGLGVVATSPLEGAPDYVRWVASRREVWVTEPNRESIEVFRLGAGNPPELVRSEAITVKGGPESLVVDDTNGVAYTHLWDGKTIVVNLATHAIRETWANGCKGSRGIALDSRRGFLFVGCAEGKAMVLDVAHGGHILGSERCSSGVDIIAFNPRNNHLYVPASADGRICVMAVERTGRVKLLGSLQAEPGVHCVASDERSQVWACSPNQGALLVFDDLFPQTSM
jgi:WD40 repeat protein